MKFKKILFAFTAVILSFTAIQNAAAAGNTKSWYCVRNKEHKQPVTDADMRYIENYNGYYIDKNHSDSCEEKVIYLTFDAGYENGNVEKILDTLKAENVKGAFFILENLIVRNTELVKRMADEGHTICNHTAKHKDMTKCCSINEFKTELENLEKIYSQYTGKEMSKYYRPPEGKFNEETMKYASELGYKTIFWSLAYADWDNNKQMSATEAKAKILDNIHNGAIILLHPTSATNAQILGEVIRELKNQGYKFSTLDELTLESAEK